MNELDRITFAAAILVASGEWSPPSAVAEVLDIQAEAARQLQARHRAQTGQQGGA